MSTTRLLLVEDDPEDVAIFRRHLPESSQLTVVTTLAAGLAAVAGGGFNVAFVDYRLGADSGLELVRATRATGNPLAIVVTTGQDIDLLGENALLAGATDFLPKADICTSAIARVTRWAMIRQFAELKRGLVISEAELREIAQLARPDRAGAAVSPATARGTWLRQVAYVSRAVTPLNAQSLTRLCARAAEGNRRLSVTGVLVSAGQSFLQILEGAPEALDVLLKQIQIDPRHDQLTIVADQLARTRHFARWGMGCHAREGSVRWTPSRWQVLTERLLKSVHEDDPLAALPAHYLEQVSLLAQGQDAPERMRQTR